MFIVRLNGWMIRNRKLPIYYNMSKNLYFLYQSIGYTQVNWRHTVRTLETTEFNTDRWNRLANVVHMGADRVCECWDCWGTKQRSSNGGDLNKVVEKALPLYAHTTVGAFILLLFFKTNWKDIRLEKKENNDKRLQRTCKKKNLKFLIECNVHGRLLPNDCYSIESTTIFAIIISPLGRYSNRYYNTIRT